MKSPLWIVTSALTILFFAVLLFILLSAKKIFEKPRIKPITVPARIELEEEKPLAPKDFRMIYEEKDIFGTFTSIAKPVTVTDVLPSLPRPPFPRPIVPRQRPSLHFLPTLPIKVTGIIASNIEENSQISVMNMNTRKTASYKVGDNILDATVLRIFPRKALVLRSNGQQETLFMYPDDVKAEMSELKDVTWTDVVQRQTDSRFLVNPTSFIARITSLAELIDSLDAVPVTKQGEAVGVRIGKMDRTSIGYALGLQPGDLVTHIADIPTNSTESRMKAYNKVAQLKMGSACIVKIVRQGRPLTYTYTLFNLADSNDKRNSLQGSSPYVRSASNPNSPRTGRDPYERQPQASFASSAQYQDTMQAMQRRDREAMNQYGAQNYARPQISDMPEAALELD